MKMPNLNDITPVLSQVGSVGGGIILAHVGKEALMGTALLNRDTPIIPDTLATNGAGVVVSVIGAVMANQLMKGPWKERIVLACAGSGAYFLIRTVNKATDALNGLGDESPAANKLKEFLQKIVPRLDGLGNDGGASATDWQRMLEEYQAPVNRVSDRPAALYGNTLQVA